MIELESIYQNNSRNYVKKGILGQLMIFYTLQQNGFAERKNHTLLDMIKSMMVQTNLLISFWEDALLSTAYLTKYPQKSIHSTPYKLWNGKKPNFEGLRP